MTYLKYFKINGNPEHIRKFEMVFWDVSLDSLNNSDMVLTITKALPNFWRTNDPKKNNAFLYMVVPSETITSVWPSMPNCDEVKYVTAKNSVDNKLCPITPAIVIHTGMTSLYLCLTPNGSLIDESGSLGI